MQWSIQLQISVAFSSKNKYPESVHAQSSI